MRPVFLLTAALCLFASCKKTVDGPEPSFWRLGNKTYLPASVVRSANAIYGNDSAGLVSLHFNSLPATGGTYTLDFAEVSIGEFYSGGPATAEVSVTGGKLTVDVHNIWMRHLPMLQDSLQLEAHLVEQ